MKNNRGQTLYYFLVFTMILIISWAMMLNIAKIIRDRMIMQNMVDNIALSVATHKARIMNFVGACNYLIGTVLSVGTLPSLVQLPSFTTNNVGSYFFGDYEKKTYNKALDKDVKTIKGIVELLQSAQEKAMQAHSIYQKRSIAESLEKGYILTISPLQMPTKEASEKYFGLKRNMKGITYIKTINTQAGNSPHFVYNPFPAYELLELIKDKLDDSEAVIVRTILEPILALCGGFVGKKISSESDYSWYIIDKENFHKQKIKVSLSKYNNKNKPLLFNILNIKYPIISVFSAAAIYNTKGTMFPTQESEFTGFPSPKITKGLFIVSGVLIAQMTSQCVKINKIFGGIVGIHLAGTFAARCIQGFIGEGNSPIKHYEKAKEGGWAAHLVPYKTGNDDD